MTAEQKSKGWSFLQKLVPLIITPSLLIGIFYTFGGWKAEIESKSFPDIDTRTRVIDHTANSVSEMELYFVREALKDGLFLKKDEADTLYITSSDFISMYGKNSIQIYQINQKLNELIEQNKRQATQIKQRQ